MKTAGSSEEAVVEFNKALAIAPSFAPALVQRGSIGLTQKNYVSAALDADRALIIDQKSADARNLKGKIYIESTRTKKLSPSSTAASSLTLNTRDAIGIALWFMAA